VTDAPTPLTFPATPDQWSEWLAERAGGQLDAARELAEQLRALDEPARALRVWNDLNIALGNCFAICGLMSQVHPDPAIRQQAETAEQEADKFATDLKLDRRVYDVLSSVDASVLDEDAARVLRLTLRDYRRAGVDRDDDVRDRLRALAEQETSLGQEFAKNIREDTHTITVTGAQLAGLPADYIAAHPADDDGRHTITTDYPDVYPFVTYASDPDARRALHLAFLQRAWPDNEKILHDLLGVRAEKAQLLGYADWPSYDAEVKMIGAGAAIGEFIDRIVAVADEPGRRDRQILLDRLREDRPEANEIDRADTTYYAELVRRERYGVDAQETRRYFDFAKVRRGLLDVTGRLFGIQYREAPDAPRWHEDVAVYDVDQDGEHVGRIYLDLHPRAGKFKHAAQFSIVAGVLGRQLPEGALVCNLPRGLMEHTEVITLFHEFGHLVHHVLGGRQSWVRFAGVATEWDFVEAPSQLLEEWAWDPDVLQTFATDDTGSPIPSALVARMRAAKDFGRAYQVRTQMFYAAVSYTLHREHVDDIDARVRELQEQYDLFPFVDGTHFHASFGHLVGYTSAYYTYMWSLVIAKDLMSGFDRADLFNADTARRYRDAILAAGGRKDAAELVEDFLGRPYSFEAYEKWLESAGAVSPS
jgi:Zn-dependent oligopeptidase